MKQIVIGLLLILFLFPLASVQAFQTKDLLSGNVDMKMQLERQDITSSTSSTSFTIKNAIFDFSNSKLNYMFEPSFVSLSTTSLLAFGTMKIENSQDPKVSNITMANVAATMDIVNIQKANSVTKYISSDLEKNAFKYITIGDATWWHVKGQVVVLDNGSATLTMEGQP